MVTGRLGTWSWAANQSRLRLTQAWVVGLWASSTLLPASSHQAPVNSISLDSTQAARWLCQPQRATV